MKWFRVYDELMDDPKIHELSDSEFRVFVYLMCLANRQQVRGGIPLDLAKTARILRLHVNKVKPAVETLQKLNIIVYDSNNPQILFLNWNKRQFKSDDVSARVKRHRNVTGNDTVTPRARTDTDTDTETDKKEAFSLPHKEEISQLKDETDKLAEQMKPGWNKVFAFVNAMRKKNKHPGAIFLALTQVALHNPKEPWPYAKQVIEVESQNFYEQDHMKESEKHKKKLD